MSAIYLRCIMALLAGATVLRIPSESRLALESKMLQIQVAAVVVAVFAAVAVARSLAEIVEVMIFTVSPIPYLSQPDLASIIITPKSRITDETEFM